MPENFNFMNTNLTPAAENEQTHAGRLTADTAGQESFFFFSPLHGVLSDWNLEYWGDLNRWHFVVFKEKELIKSNPENHSNVFHH